MGLFIYSKLNSEMDILRTARNKCKNRLSELAKMAYENTEKFVHITHSSHK